MAGSLQASASLSATVQQGLATSALREFRDLDLSPKFLFSHIQSCHPVHFRQSWLEGALHIAKGQEPLLFPNPEIQLLSNLQGPQSHIPVLWLWPKAQPSAFWTSSVLNRWKTETHTLSLSHVHKF